MPSPADSVTDSFVVPVDGVGVFTFAKKNMRTQIKIECEYARLTEGIQTVTNFLDTVATAMANLKILTVEAPDGWDIEAMDPEETESYIKMMKVWSALRDKQASFRTGVKVAGKDAGPGPGTDSGVLVSP